MGPATPDPFAAVRLIAIPRVYSQLSCSKAAAVSSMRGHLRKVPFLQGCDNGR